MDTNINSLERETFGWEIILNGDKNYNASLGEIYDDKENGILVFIKSCDRSKRASLKFADEHVKIRFIDEECDVKSVYKNITPVSL